MKNKFLLLATTLLLAAGAFAAYRFTASPSCEGKSCCAPKGEAAASGEATASTELKACTPEEAAAQGCAPCPPGSTPCCTVGGVPYCKN